MLLSRRALSGLSNAAKERLRAAKRKFYVQQKFSLEFSEEKEDASVGLSGNPGYIVGLPLLLGKSDDN